MVKVIMIDIYKILIRIGEATNPYGTTKYTVEKMMMELAASDPEWTMSLLRYFNPTGAHKSGDIGIRI